MIFLLRTKARLAADRKFRARRAWILGRYIQKQLAYPFRGGTLLFGGGNMGVTYLQAEPQCIKLDKLQEF